MADAVESYSRAIALKPDYWEAYVGRAFAHGNAGSPHAAIVDLNKVLANSPMRTTTRPFRLRYGRLDESVRKLSSGSGLNRSKPDVTLQKAGSSHFALTRRGGCAVAACRPVVYWGAN